MRLNAKDYEEYDLFTLLSGSSCQTSSSRRTFEFVIVASWDSRLLGARGSECRRTDQRGCVSSFPHGSSLYEAEAVRMRCNTSAIAVSSSDAAVTFVGERLGAVQWVWCHGEVFWAPLAMCFHWRTVRWAMLCHIPHFLYHVNLSIKLVLFFPCFKFKRVLERV